MNPYYMNDCDCREKNSLNTASDAVSHFLLDWKGNPIFPEKPYRLINYLYYSNGWATCDLTTRERYSSQYIETSQGWKGNLKFWFQSLMGNEFINLYEGIRLHGFDKTSDAYFGIQTYRRDYNAIYMDKQTSSAGIWYPERPFSGSDLDRLPVPVYYFKNSDSQQYLGSLGGNGWLRGSMNPEDPNVYCYFAMEPLF